MYNSIFIPFQISFLNPFPLTPVAVARTGLAVLIHGIVEEQLGFCW